MTTKQLKSQLSRESKDWVALLARIVIGGPLFYSGLLHITNFQANVAQVQLFSIPIPTWMEIAVGYAQPPLELIVGALLIIGLFSRVAALLGTLAMAVFIFGISWAWAQGILIDCGCFSVGGQLDPNEQHQYLQDIIRDLIFAAAGIWLIYRPKSVLSLDNVLFKPIVFDDFTDLDTATPDKTRD